MTRELPSKPKDLISMLSRRKTWLLASFFGISLTVIGVSLLLPKEFKSETLILVEPQKIPEDYVHATVTSDVTDRLQTIQEEIMSRTRLSSIIEELDLYPKMRQTKSMDEVVTAMRKDITVDVLSDNHPEKKGVGAFKISYLGPTPETAQTVTQKIADLFIAENLKVRDQQAQGTRQFISAEVARAREQLEEQEKKIKAFNAEHLGALPEQEQTNLQMVSQYQALSQANSEAIDRATQQRSYLQSMLGMMSTKDKTAPAPLSATQLDLQKKKQELNAARAKYTDSYPEVIKLQGDVAALQAQVNAEPKVKTQDAATAGQSDQFQSQLVSIDQEIKQRTAREGELEGQIRGLQGKIEVLPNVQAEFADLNRDYQDMQKNYQSLVEKENASGMAAELEHRNQSEQFRILDPASLPTKPDSPKLAIIDGAGVLAALVIGLLLALLAEVRDVAVHDVQDVEHYLSFPIISTIPSIPLLQEDLSPPVRQLPARRA